MAVSVFNSAITAAYDAVMDMKSDRNWLLCAVEGEALALLGSGTGGRAELLRHLDPGKVHFGLLNVLARETRGGKDLSRSRWVFFTLVGPATPADVKVRAAAVGGEVAALFPGFTLRVDVASDPEPLHKETLARKLLERAAGSPRTLIFGPGDELDVTSLA